MNPETTDLSTWRDDAPPTALRAQVVESARRRPVPRLLPRVGAAGAMIGGLSVAALLLTAPTPAVAGLSARTLVTKAQRALAAAPRVHLREFVDGRLVTETWFAGDRWRVTSPVDEGGDRIFRYARLQEAIPGAVVRGGGKPRGQREVLVPLGSLHDDRKTQPNGSYEYSIGIDRQGAPMGLTYWSRRGGKVVTMMESAPQTRDFRMEALAPSYFAKGARLAYRDLGPVADANRPARRIEITAQGQPDARQIWTLRAADGLPVRLTRERRLGSDWQESGTSTFEYPREIPASTFDPKTLAEHGL